MSSETNNKAGWTASILPLAKELSRIYKQAESLGLFINDRELLECPKCDLIEDVAYSGGLTTYHRNSNNWNDCGLRFYQRKEDIFGEPPTGPKTHPIVLLNTQLINALP